MTKDLAPSCSRKDCEAWVTTKEYMAAVERRLQSSLKAHLSFAVFLLSNSVLGYILPSDEFFLSCLLSFFALFLHLHFPG